MIKIIIGLICVMLANIFLGITLAKLKKEFKKEKLLDGLVKYAGILIGISLMYLTGYLNSDIMIATIIVSVDILLGVREPVVRCEPVRQECSNYREDINCPAIFSAVTT